MMPVVIDHEDARGLAADLETALDAREGAQSLLDSFEGRLEIEADAAGGEGIEDVVAARHLNRDGPQDTATMQDLELGLDAGEREAPGGEIRARLEPVGDHALLDLGDHLLDVGLVEAEHGRPV